METTESVPTSVMHRNPLYFGVTQCSPSVVKKLSRG